MRWISSGSIPAFSCATLFIDIGIMILSSVPLPGRRLHALHAGRPALPFGLLVLPLWFLGMIELFLRYRTLFWVAAAIYAYFFLAFGWFYVAGKGLFPSLPLPKPHRLPAGLSVPGPGSARFTSPAWSIGAFLLDGPVTARRHAGAPRPWEHQAAARRPRSAGVRGGECRRNRRSDHRQPAGAL